jgi:hypothetical protein
MRPKSTKGSCNLASRRVCLDRLCCSTSPANYNQPVNDGPLLRTSRINKERMTQRAIIPICSVRWYDNYFHSRAERMVCVRCWNNIDTQSLINRYKSKYNCKFSKTTKEYQWNGSRITVTSIDHSNREVSTQTGGHPAHVHACACGKNILVSKAEKETFLSAFTSL